MNQDFQHRMAEAARLTRAGDLAAATALLQRTLQGPASSEPPAAAMDTILDVDCREVLEPGTPVPASRPPLSPATARGVPALETGRSGSGPSARAWRLFTPPQLAGGPPRPLVVMLHGCTQDANDFARGTGMDDLACEHGLHVLYPEQSRQANPQGCWNWFKPSQRERGRGEVATLAAMIRQVSERRSVDPSRVYVAGLSAGGAMAAAFAAAYPDRVAAIGVHSGLGAGAARDLPSALGALQGRPVGPLRALRTPAIVFHGDADPTVHTVNGDAVFASVLSDVGTVHAERLDGPYGREATRRRRIVPDGRVASRNSGCCTAPGTPGAAAARTEATPIRMACRLRPRCCDSSPLIACRTTGVDPAARAPRRLIAPDAIPGALAALQAAIDSRDEAGPGHDRCRAVREPAQRRVEGPRECRTPLPAGPTSVLHSMTEPVH